MAFSDDDDKVVWADHHEREVEKRDKRIQDLEADIAKLTARPICLCGMGQDGATMLVRAQEEIRRLTIERDQAIAHDRQPYPTAWAYEQACKALRAKTDRLRNFEERNRRMRKVLAELVVDLEAGAESTRGAYLRILLALHHDDRDSTDLTERPRGPREGDVDVENPGEGDPSQDGGAAPSDQRMPLASEGPSDPQAPLPDGRRGGLDR